MDYSRKLEALQNRRGDTTYLQRLFSADSLSKVINEEAPYLHIDYPDSVKYTLGAMSEVDAQYTQNTLKEGERIENQLAALRNMGYEFTFRFQGSTTNNTHIKQYSDIDILVLQEKFIFTPKPLHPFENWAYEQKSLRQRGYELLNSAYPAAVVDNSGTFSISLSGGSLRRDIDVVPACWDYNKNPYATVDEEKGVKVFSKDCGNSNINYPFLNNSLIEQKDRNCHGNYRKGVRLLKTLKADSSRNIDVSSYDIVSILYNMDNANYCVENQYLALVTNILNHLQSLVKNWSYFCTLDVPDGTRKISDKTSYEALSALTVEMGDLEKDLVNELCRVRKSLNQSFENYNVSRRLHG
jgi:hypothetical protein